MTAHDISSSPHGATITVAMQDCAGDHGALALIAPLGLALDGHALERFEAPAGWSTTIVAEKRTGQLAAVMVPPQPGATATIVQRFTPANRPTPLDLFDREQNSLTLAADDLARDAVAIAGAAGGGHAGLVALIHDTARRFDYGQVPAEQRWYAGRDSIPAVACAVGNCIDINTYLIAAARAAGYEAAYITCYFFADGFPHVPNSMHCWVRTRVDGIVEDWDIAHFKKMGRADVHATLNPMPGARWPLAYGRGHIYSWNGLRVEVSTPSEPMWILPGGKVIWAGRPTVSLGK